jgi:streptogramin lyase
MTRLALLGVLLLFHAVPAPAQVKVQPAPLPDELREVVFGGGKRDQFEVTIGGQRFRALVNLGSKPALAWPTDAKKTVLAKDRTAAVEWLTKGGADLGLRGLQVRFLRKLTWRGAEVWEYELLYMQRPVLDARVQLFWRDGGFVGLSSTFVPPTKGVEPAPRKVAADEVWYAQSTDGGYRMVLARRVTRKTAKHTVTEIVTARGTINTIYEAHESPTPERAAITEYSVPQGTFPDQIWADSTGRIWFSQPLQDMVTQFDPKTKQFKQHSTSPARQPDGLMVDDRDRVWTGCYLTGHLGMLDVPTGKFTYTAAPYSSARLAIPSVSGHETVWITDHLRNRISEFDPATNKWLGSYVMPTASCWVVAGALDPARDDVYFTEYAAHALGLKSVGKNPVDISDPNRGGPSFLGFHDDKVYYSLWTQARLAEYDVVSKKFTAYNFPQSAEIGGPMSIAPNGDVIVGTRRAGYIMVFHPAKKSFTSFQIPTSTAGLKDGLTVAPDGTIWFTESGRNKIASLRLP